MSNFREQSATRLAPKFFAANPLTTIVAGQKTSSTFPNISESAKQRVQTALVNAVEKANLSAIQSSGPSFVKAPESVGQALNKSFTGPSDSAANHYRIR